MEPVRDRFVTDGSAIRQIAAVWSDAAISRFLGRDELRPIIYRSQGITYLFSRKTMTA